MIILGINAHHPDSSAAIVRDGKLIAACEEERFRRIKHFAGFPEESIKYCLREANVFARDITHITIPRQPRARIYKKILYGLRMPSLACRRMSAWKETFSVKTRLSQLFDIDEDKVNAKIVKVEHHRAHLASSFFVSGFNKAFLFSADALGDFASTMWAVGEGNRIKILGETTFPHSLGFYYTAITQYLGFLHFGDEYKIMGLAPYGEPAYRDEFAKILMLKNRKFKLDLKYFLQHKGSVDMNFKDGYPKINTLFSSYLEKRLGRRRMPEEPLEKRHKNIAFSLQERLEEAIKYLVNALSPKDISNLCLSGGIFHNSAANGKLFNSTHFKRIYVPPAPGDAGLAIGAAFYLWNQMLGKPRSFRMEHAYWGPEHKKIATEVECRKDALVSRNCGVEEVKDESALCKKIAQEISNGKIVGWFQGRMELGPRALGNRSILADPRRKDMKDILNKRIKQREPFRPFAPSILEENTGDYFKKSHPSPFMSFVHSIKENKKNTIPAVCHVDGTARLQTVNRDANPVYWKLINEFKNITGVPVLLNTSFNENEPITCSPEEAIKCFLRTEMDTLVMGPFIFQKKMNKNENFHHYSCL